MSFGAIADGYDRQRPGPPDAAADWLLPGRCQVAVDLAAGTGLLTRRLTGKAGRTISVEPDPRMAAVLRDRSPGAQVTRGVGEAIPLADASADAVLVSSAWHWIDPDRAVPEVARVLRDGGRFGVVWTSRDRQVEWLRGLSPSRGLDGTSPADRDHVRRWARRREIDLPDGSPFGGAATRMFTYTRAMTIDAIVGMLSTYSGVITASPEEQAAELAYARARLRERFPGVNEIEVPMRSWCWRADRLPR